MSSNCVIEYRKKHPRCKYCKHLHLVAPNAMLCPDFYVCVAKGKMVRDMLPDMTKVPRIFCSCYEVKENE